jgi:hypothetical protein
MQPWAIAAGVKKMLKYSGREFTPVPARVLAGEGRRQVDNNFSLLTYFNYWLELDRVVLARNMATRERLSVCRILISHFRWWSVYV